MTGKLLIGRWPDAPPPEDADYFAPTIEGGFECDAGRNKTAGRDTPRGRSNSSSSGSCSGRERDDEDSESTESDDGSGRQARSQADKAVALASECSLFADDQDADVIYADITVHEHRETLRVRSAQFREWLRHRFFVAYQVGLRDEALKLAVETIVARAKYGGERRTAPVFQRSARVGDTIYLDLCNDRREAVEIDAHGWRVGAVPAVRFCRSRGMQSIPTPIPGGSLDLLRAVLNVKSEADFVLLVAWLLHALGGVPPYPLLPLGGEPGAGKSTVARFLRTLIDPNKLPLRPMPLKEDDLFVSAARSHVAAFDNLSTISGCTSDALCRLSDGSGLGKRTLYSDDDETLIMAASPIILTAIGDVVSRPDLADRAVFVTLEVIPADVRRGPQELRAEFERARPSILGALLTALSHGLRTRPAVRLERLPRMADFATWVSACEGVLWAPGTFMRAYAANRAAAVEAVLEADELACVLRRWLSRQADGGRWQGTPTELLRALNQQAEGTGARYRSNDWPRSAASLSSRLRRIAPGLRETGIEMKLGDRTAARRLVSFNPVVKPPESSSSSSSSSFEGALVEVGDARDGDDDDSAESPQGLGAEGVPVPADAVRRPIDSRRGVR